MAKDDLDDFDLDDIDIPDFDSDGLDGTKDDRDPVEKVGKSFVTSLGQEATNASNVKTVIDQALPKGYGKALRDAEDLIGKGGDIANTIRTELEPAKRNLKKIGRIANTKLKGVLPEGISKKLEEISADNDPKDEKLDEQTIAINSTLTDIFGAQEEEANKQRILGELKDNEKFETNIQALTAIQRGINKQVAYQEAISSKVQRKSLELQYKQYFIAKDQYTLFGGYVKETKTQLDSIVKNTALPDFVKKHSSEALKEELRRKAIGAVTGKVGDFTKDFRDNLFENLNTKVKSIASDFRDGIESGADMAEMLGDEDGPDGAETAGMIGASLVAPTIAKKIGGWVGSKVPKGGKIEEIGNRLLFASENKDQMLIEGITRLGEDSKEDTSVYLEGSEHPIFTPKDLMTGSLRDLNTGKIVTHIDDITGPVINKQNEVVLTQEQYDAGIEDGTARMGWKDKFKTKAKGMLGSALEDITPKYNKEFEINDDSETLAEEHGMYTSLSDRVLTKVIPSLLEGILHTTEKIESGDSNIEAKVYNHTTGELEARSTVSKQITDKILDKNTKESIDGSMSRLINELDPNEQLSNITRKELSKQLLEDAMDGNKYMNVGRLMSPDGLGSIKDENVQKEIISFLVDNYMDDSGKTKTDIATTSKLLKSSREFRTIQSDIPDYQDQMKRMANLYGKGLLNTDGLLEGNKGNVDLVRDFLLGEQEPGGSRGRIVEISPEIHQAAIDAYTKPQKGKGSTKKPKNETTDVTDTVATKPDADQTQKPKKGKGKKDVKPKPAEKKGNKLTLHRRPVDEVPAYQKGRFKPEYEGKVGEIEDWMERLLPEEGHRVRFEALDLWLYDDGTILTDSDRVEHLTNGNLFNIFDFEDVPKGTVEKLSTGFEGGGVTKSSSRKGGLDGKGGFAAMLHPDEIVIDKLNPRGWIDKLMKSKKGVDEDEIVENIDAINRSTSGISEHLPTMDGVLDRIGESVDALYSTIEDKIPDGFFDEMNERKTKYTEAAKEQRDKIKPREWFGKLTTAVKKTIDTDNTPEVKKPKSRKDTKPTKNLGVVGEIIQTRESIVDAINQGTSINLRGFKMRDIDLPDVDFKGKFGKAKEGLLSKVNIFKDTSTRAGKRVKDLYIKGRRSPALEAYKLQMGEYRDLYTGKIIKSYEDIKGPITDATGNVVVGLRDRKNLVDKDGKVTRAIKGIQDLGKGALGMAGDAVNKSKEFMGNRLKNVGGIAGGIGEFTGLLKRTAGDIYMRGIPNPIVKFRDLKAGLYIDAETGKPIYDLSKLKGDLKDKAGNVVLTLEDFKKNTLMDRFGGKLKLDVAGLREGIGSAVNKVTSTAGGILDFQKNIIGNATGFISKQYNKTLDIYVEGDDTPRLRATIMKNGGYLDKHSGEVISDIKDIRGPVVDLDGNELLSAEDLKLNIYTSRGRLLKGLKDLVTSTATKGINLTKNIASKGVNLAKKGFKGLKGLAGKLKGKFSSKSSDDTDGWGEMQTNYLDMIYDLLDERLEKPKKKQRLGGWRDQFSDDDEEDQNPLGGKDKKGKKDKKNKKKKKGGSLMDMLGMKNVGKKVKDVAKWAAPAAMAAGGSILSGLGTAAGFLGSGIATVASGVATVVSAPVVLGAAVVAAVAVGGYLAYKYLYKAPKGPIHKFRLAQYGTMPDNKDNLARISSLEDMLYEEIQFTDAGPEIKNVTDQEVYELWGVPQDDESKLDSFNNWFHNRFKPIFLLHASAINKYSPGMGILEVDSKLPRELKAAYLTATRLPMGGDTPYNIRSNPFDGEENLTTSKEITEFYEAAMEEFKEDSKEGSVEEARKSNEEALDKIGDKLDKDDNAMSAKERAELYNKQQAAKKKNKVADDSVEGKYTKSNNVIALPYKGKVGALMAVRMKAYGLTEMDATKVGQLLHLEKRIISELTVKDKYVTFNGDAEDEFKRYGGMFGLDPESDVQYENWMTWFIYRFMAVLNNYANTALYLKPKISLKNIDNELEPEEQHRLATEIYKTLNSNRINVFSVKNSPWVDYKLNTKGSSALTNIFAIEDAIKNSEPLPEEATVNKPKPKKVVDKEAEVTETYEDTTTSSDSSSGNKTKGSKGNIPSSDDKFFTDGAGLGEVGGTIPDLPPTDAIKKAADATGVDENILMSFAKLESGLDPKAKASTSSATGLFQFTDGTWKDIVTKTGQKYGVDISTDRTNATANAIMGGEYLKANRSYIEGYKEAGIPLKVALYLAHFLGPGGARRFIKTHRKDPNTNIRSAVSGAAYGANRGMLAGKTTSSFIQHLLGKFSTAEGTSTEAYVGNTSSKDTDSSDTVAMVDESGASEDPSYDGGGITPSGPRKGGVDGKGGFNAILHPNEIVLDRYDADGSVKDPEELLKEYQVKERRSRSMDTDAVPSIVGSMQKALNPLGNAISSVVSSIVGKDDESTRTISQLEEHDKRAKEQERAAIEAKREAMKIQELETLGSMDGTLRSSLMVQEEIKDLLLKVVEQNQQRTSDVEEDTKEEPSVPNINENRNRVQGQQQQTTQRPNFNMSR